MLNNKNTHTDTIVCADFYILKKYNTIREASKNIIKRWKKDHYAQYNTGELNQATHSRIKISNDLFFVRTYTHTHITLLLCLLLSLCVVYPYIYPFMSVCFYWVFFFEIIVCTFFTYYNVIIKIYFMSLYMRRKNMNKWMISAWFFDGFLFIYILKKKKKTFINSTFVCVR